MFYRIPRVLFGFHFVSVSCNVIPKPMLFSRTLTDIENRLWLFGTNSSKFVSFPRLLIPRVSVKFHWNCAVDSLSSSMALVFKDKSTSCSCRSLPHAHDEVICRGCFKTFRIYGMTYFPRSYYQSHDVDRCWKIPSRLRCINCLCPSMVNAAKCLG